MGSIGNFIINFTVKIHIGLPLSVKKFRIIKKQYSKNYIPENKIIPMGVDNIFFQKKLTEKNI